MMSGNRFGQFQNWLLQSPPAEWALDQLRELLIGAIRQGPVPQHIAFVMDGNRRFARTHKLETIEGHSLGFEALARILEVCYKSGVKVVTIYAFSLENFKRSKFEVDALMEMAKVKLTQMAQHGELLDRYGASVRVLGKRDVLKPDVLEAMQRAESMTVHNKRAILNVCFPYTSRDEITTAIQRTVDEYSKPLSPLKRPFSETHIARNIRAQNLSSIQEESENSRSPSPASEGAKTQDTNASDEASTATSTNEAPSTAATSTAGIPTPPIKSTTSPSMTDKASSPINPQKPVWNYPDPEQITSATLTDHMFTAGTPPLDLLIRTSGVERLSDFMLWQAHQNTHIKFLNILWPEFDLWHFLPVLLEWQRLKRKQDEVEERDGRSRRRVPRAVTP